MPKSSPPPKVGPEEEWLYIAPEHLFWFILIFIGPSSGDGLFKENKKALSDSQYNPPSDFHDLSANPPNMKPPVLQITAAVAPLLSHLAWKSDAFHPSCEPRYRSSKSPDNPSSDNQLSIWELWCLDKSLNWYHLPVKWTTQIILESSNPQVCWSAIDATPGCIQGKVHHRCFTFSAVFKID